MAKGRKKTISVKYKGYKAVARENGSVIIIREKDQTVVSEAMICLEKTKEELKRRIDYYLFLTEIANAEGKSLIEAEGL